MSKSRRILAGAAWTYGAQIATMILQFAYAAFTARIVSPSGFGVYAVALTVAALISLIANGGLGQAVGRMNEIDRSVVRALSTYGLLMGALGGAILFVSAPLWAAIWGAPEAVEPIRWLSISAALSPCLGLASGLMRRLGNFRKLAAATLLGNVGGMILGALAVAAWGTPSALLVSPIASQVCILIASYGMTNRLLFGVSRLGAARDSIRFSWKMTLATLFSYVSGNLGPWAVTTIFGAAMLGQWNRALVVTGVPFHQIQTAMIQSVYPEFRHDVDSPIRAHAIWPDLMALVGWVVLPASGIAAVILPALVPVLFGPGWEIAAELSSPLALIAGLQAVVMMLWSAVEALGRFRWIWLAQIVALVVNAVGAAAAYSLHDWTPIFVAIALSLLASHGVHIWFCNRAGYLSLRRLFSNYLKVLIGTGFVALLAAAGVLSISAFWEAPLLVAYFATLMALVCILSWKNWRRLPPIVLARKYNLLP